MCLINPERGDAHGLKKLDTNRICDVELSFVLLLCYLYQNAGQKYTHRHSGTYGAPLLRGNMRFLAATNHLYSNNCILRVYFHFTVFAFCEKLLALVKINIRQNTSGGGDSRIIREIFKCTAEHTVIGDEVLRPL